MWRNTPKVARLRRGGAMSHMRDCAITEVLLQLFASRNEPQPFQSPSFALDEPRAVARGHLAACCAAIASSMSRMALRSCDVAAWADAVPRVGIPWAAFVETRTSRSSAQLRQRRRRTTSLGCAMPSSSPTLPEACRAVAGVPLLLSMRALTAGPPDALPTRLGRRRVCRTRSCWLRRQCPKACSKLVLSREQQP